ncbi:hypothetical protein [Polaribacter sp.]|uniref:hypothetical protein n=1 Tax=Polaribacter sp. TaxID=1920175 RepID=UPI003F6C8DDE
MEKSTENINQNNFLKKGSITDISKHHKDYLGTDIPEDYFAKSKLSILDKIKDEVKEDVKTKQQNPKKQKLFHMRLQFTYIAAACLVFIFSLTVWLQNLNIPNDKKIDTIESLALEDDILIQSLLVADEDVDAFADATLFNEVVVKAEIQEQKLDNLILDSLILEDSLLEDYMDDKLIETIVL